MLVNRASFVTSTPTYELWRYLHPDVIRDVRFMTGSTEKVYMKNTMVRYGSQFSPDLGNRHIKHSRGVQIHIGVSIACSEKEFTVMTSVSSLYVVLHWVFSLIFLAALRLFIPELLNLDLVIDFLFG